MGGAHSVGDGLSSSDLPKFEVTWVYLHGLSQVRERVKKNMILMRKREGLRLD